MSWRLRQSLKQSNHIDSIGVMSFGQKTFVRQSHSDKENKVFNSLATVFLLRHLPLQSPGANVIKLFTAVIYYEPNKLECLSLGRHFRPSLTFAPKVSNLPFKRLYKSGKT